MLKGVGPRDRSKSVRVTGGGRLKVSLPWYVFTMMAIQIVEFATIVYLLTR